MTPILLSIKIILHVIRVKNDDSGQAETRVQMIQIGVDFGGTKIEVAALDSTEMEAPPRWCGQRGCLGSWISGSGMERDYHQIYGAVRSGQDIISLMRAGDTNANATRERYMDRLGRGFATVCNIIDPDTIVLGVGLSNVSEIYTVLPAIIGSYVFSDSWNAKSAPARWGDSPGGRGAARLWAARI